MEMESPNCAIFRGRDPQNVPLQENQGRVFLLAGCRPWLMSVSPQAEHETNKSLPALIGISAMEHLDFAATGIVLTEGSRPAPPLSAIVPGKVTCCGFLQNDA